MSSHRRGARWSERHERRERTEFAGGATRHGSGMSGAFLLFPRGAYARVRRGGVPDGEVGGRAKRMHEHGSTLAALMLLFGTATATAQTTHPVTPAGAYESMTPGNQNVARAL